MALLADGLLPASFRGVPFAVQSDDVGGGRRIALHQYPGRDVPWAEDMGRDARRFRLRGFIVKDDSIFFGGPIAIQRALLLAALEKEGPGVLTHPSIGILNVSVARFSLGQDLGAGRMSSVDVEFVESGKRSFPSILSNSSGLLTAANLCKVAIALDFAHVVALAVRAGGTRDDIPKKAAGWSSSIAAAGSDATALQRLSAQLPGNLGRYSRGSNVGYAGSTSYISDTTIEQLVDAAAAQRAAIAQAGTELAATVTGLTVTTADADVAAAGATLLDALVAACADPADALRLLFRLLAGAAAGGTGIGGAVDDMFRRNIIAALASAAGAYQPASYDDAFALLSSLAVAFDAEILIVGDQALDGTFTALRALRGAVVQDLRDRGASLAPIRTYGFGGSLPAIVLANRIYGDIDRADELVRQADPVCPLFMPASFQALAA